MKHFHSVWTFLLVEHTDHDEAGETEDNSDTLHMRMPCPEANDANTLSFCSNETKKKVGTST